MVTIMDYDKKIPRDRGKDDVWDEDGDDDEYNEHNDDPDDCYFV